MPNKKIKKLKEIKGLNVVFVSYVPKGANQQDFIIRKDIEETNTKQNIKIISKQKEERTVLGIVYEPFVEDAHGDFMSDTEIMKACNSFNKYFGAIDKEHNCIPGVGNVLESYIAPTNMTLEGVDVKKGTWLLKTQPDEETWEQIKAGDYNGYSLYGYAQEYNEVSEIEFKLRKNQFEISKEENKKRKDFNTELENMKNNDIFNYMWILNNAIHKDLWNYTGSELKENILISIDQFREKVSGMTFEVKKSENNNDNKKDIDNNNDKQKVSEEVQMEKQEIIEIVEAKVGELIESKMKAIEESISGINENIKKSRENDNTADVQKEVKELSEKTEKQMEEIKKDFKELKESFLDTESKSHDEGNSGKPKKISSDNVLYSS